MEKTLYSADGEPAAYISDALTYEPPPLPDLGFDYSSEDFEEFLRKGQVTL